MRAWNDEIDSWRTVVIPAVLTFVIVASLLLGLGQISGVENAEFREALEETQGPPPMNLGGIVAILGVLGGLMLMYGGLAIPIGYHRGKVKFLQFCGTGMHFHTVYYTQEGFTTQHPLDSGSSLSERIESGLETKDLEGDE